MNPTNKNGGPAFPCQVENIVALKDQDGNETAKLTLPAGYVPGMSLRDWLASQETLSDFDSPDSVPSIEMCEALVGPRPEGGWIAGNGMAMHKWEAKWRAGLKVIRADALLEALKGGKP